MNEIVKLSGLQSKAVSDIVKPRQDDIEAIARPWSNGQAEGQINRLKTLKRSMYGRAGIELLRARILPLEPNEHAK